MRGDEVHVVDDLSTGSGRTSPPGRRSTSRHPRRRSTTSQGRRRDVVFHLAAQADVRESVADPAHDADVNVLGTINVLEAAQARRRAGGLRLDRRRHLRRVRRAGARGGPSLPLSPYGAAKLAGEHYLGALAPALRHDATSSLRYGNVYGPRQDPHGEAGVVAIFLGRLLDGRAADDLRRRHADPRLRLRRRRRRGARSRRSTAAPAASSTSAPGIATTVLELFEVCRRSPARSPSPCYDAAAARRARSQRARRRQRGGRDSASARRSRSRTASPRRGSLRV